MKLEVGKTYEIVWSDGEDDDYVILSDEGGGWYRVQYERGIKGREMLVNVAKAVRVIPQF